VLVRRPALRSKIIARAPSATYPGRIQPHHHAVFFPTASTSATCDHPARRDPCPANRVLPIPLPTASTTRSNHGAHVLWAKPTVLLVPTPARARNTLSWASPGRVSIQPARHDTKPTCTLGLRTRCSTSARQCASPIEPGRPGRNTRVGLANHLAAMVRLRSPSGFPRHFDPTSAPGTCCRVRTNGSPFQNLARLQPLSIRNSCAFSYRASMQIAL